MRMLLVIALVMVSLVSYSQNDGLFVGVKPIASKVALKTLHIYKPYREVVKVEEGRLYFKGSGQGDFIMERPSYKSIVFDRTNQDHWTIELYAVDGFNVNMSPIVSIYTVECCASFVENSFEAVIRRSSPRGPAWSTLKVVETADGYVFEFGDAHDRWNGKIAMKWVCKKGNFEDPGKEVADGSRELNVDGCEVIEVDE